MDQLETTKKLLAQFTVDIARESDTTCDSQVLRQAKAAITRLDGLIEKGKALTPETELAWFHNAESACKAVLSFMELHPITSSLALSSDQEARLRELFAACDTDHNGYISMQELPALMRRLGDNPSNHMLQCIMWAWDKNHDGQLSWEEFVQIVLHRGIPTKEKEERNLRKAFAVFDLDKDGTISVAELRKVLTSRSDRMTDAEVDELFAMVDVNHDGKISYEEFVHKLL
ncbi:calmodulin 1 [Pelomyxa schiedti]|nr:calmodulin 1 [Pelomyxa schiedti]